MASDKAALVDHVPMKSCRIPRRRLLVRSKSSLTRDIYSYELVLGQTIDGPWLKIRWVIKGARLNQTTDIHPPSRVDRLQGGSCYAATAIAPTFMTWGIISAD